MNESMIKRLEDIRNELEPISDDYKEKINTMDILDMKFSELAVSILLIVDRLKEDNEKQGRLLHHEKESKTMVKDDLNRAEEENKELRGKSGHILLSKFLRELEAENKDKESLIEEFRGKHLRGLNRIHTLEAKLKEAECDLVEWSYQMGSAIDIGGLDPKMALDVIEKILKSIRDKGGKE